MGSVESWSLTAKLCFFCKLAPATVFCRADTAFLCAPCDARVHAANKLASRHARVWVCEVCEQAPAAVTCKADAAALCPSCDRDIHSANSLACRHKRLPVVPFYDAASAAKSTSARSQQEEAEAEAEFSEEEEGEAEAASWLLPDPGNSRPGVGPPEYKSAAEYLFSDMDSFLDLDLIATDQKPDLQKQQQKEEYEFPGPVVDGYPSFDMEYPVAKPLMYSFASQTISHSVSSSSMDVGVVPEQGAAADAASFGKSDGIPPMAVSGVDREVRVLRYREKRKNRRFEKTIRYASRKAYAETRPRIKGRFAKRSELELDVESLLATDASSYGVVPTF